MAMARGGPPPPPGPGPMKGASAKKIPSKAATPAPKPKPPPSGGGGMDGVLQQLTGRIGPPKGSSGSDFNPSAGARPGYQKPAGLPEGGGTLGTEKCFWSLSGPQQSQVSVECVFKLICKNEKKEFHEIPTSLLETEMWRPDNKERTMIRGKIHQTEKGKYDLVFRPHHPGEHVFNVWVKGELEKKAIYAEGKEVPLNVIKDPTLTTSEVYFSALGHGLNGGQVGKETSFEIWAKDASGQVQDMDHNLLSVTLLAGLKKMTAHIEYLGTGHFKAEYTPMSPGEIEVLVQYGGTDVIRKKIEFTFGIDPSRTTIVDPPTNVTVGHEIRFTIQAKSQMGHDLNYGGQKFDCAVSGPPKGVQGLVIRDETDGKYTTRFKIITPGQYKFFVKLGGVPISGSPFVVTAT